MNGLPACVCSRMPHIPDGRTVLTKPEALNRCNGSVMRTWWHLPPFIPDTNSIEALHRQLRKIIKTRGSFPTEDAARKLIYLAITKAGSPLHLGVRQTLRFCGIAW